MKTTVLLLTSLLFAFSCVEDFPNDPALQVTLSTATSWGDSLALLDTVTVELTVTDGSGQVVRGARVTWESTDETILSVSPIADSTSATYAAVLRGISEGSATVNVTLDSTRFTGEAFAQALSVVPLSIETTEPQTVALDVGDIRTISVSLRTADGGTTDAANVSWSSSNPQVVAVVPSQIGVDASGVATALLSAHATGESAIVTVAVEEAGGGRSVEFIVSVFRDSWPAGLAVGEEATVAIVDVSGGAIDSISWSAQDVTVLGVDEGGVAGTSLIGRRQGATHVVAQVSRSGFPRFSMELPLQVVPVTVERLGWSDELKLGDTGTFSIRTLGFDSSAVAMPVRWAVSNEAVLRIISLSVDTLSAQFSGIGLGSAEVILSMGGGELEERELRVPLPVRQQWKQVSVGAGHTCAVAQDDTAYCWGSNESGQLGDGSVRARQLPTQVGSYEEVAAGSLHSCGRLGGFVDCWGSYIYDQLGEGSGPCWFPNLDIDICYKATPQRLPIFVIAPTWGGSLESRSRLVAGGVYTCVIVADDIPPARCFGGEPPFGDPVLRVEGGGAGAYLGGAGGSHVCYLLEIGSIWCTSSSNGSGQLGDGTLGPGPTPGVLVGRVVAADSVPLSIGYPVISAAGDEHHCVHAVKNVLGNTFGIWCWGANGSGQLGPSAPAVSPFAVFVPPPAPVRTLTLGAAHSCMLSDQGIAYCWGSNSVGQLGDGSVGGTRPEPAVAGHGIEFIDLSAGGDVTCGVATDRSLFCWGSGLGGTPVRVGEPVN